MRSLNGLRRSNGCDRRGCHRRWGRSRWRRRFRRVRRRVGRAGFRMIRAWWWLARSRVIGSRRRLPWARVIGPRRRTPWVRVVGPGWRPRLVVMRRRGRFVSFVFRRRLDRRGRRRWRVGHKPWATGGDWRAVRGVVRVEWTANARSGIAPRARAFRIIRAHGWTRRIGWVIRASVSHGWTTTGRSCSQGQRAVVHAVGSDCKADQHSSRASGSGNDADRPGRFPRPPLDSICAYTA
jgi:hypothetical protein